MQYLKHTKNDRLTLDADEPLVADWHVDALFAVHPDLRSFTGISVTFGKGFPINISHNQSIIRKLAVRGIRQCKRRFMLPL